MRAIKIEGVWEYWTNQRVDGVLYPSSWPEEELAALGILQVVDEPPTGDVQVVSYSLEDVAGVPTVVYITEDVTPEATPLRLIEIAAAKLEVVDGELIGIEKGHGMAGGYAMDDVAYVYFNEEEPDLDYIVIPNEGVTKFTDHVEVMRSGLSVFSFIIQRVK